MAEVTNSIYPTVFENGRDTWLILNLAAAFVFIVLALDVRRGVFHSYDLSSRQPASWVKSFVIGIVVSLALGVVGIWSADHYSDCSYYRDE
jgi:hypothetical protein